MEASSDRWHVFNERIASTMMSEYSLFHFWNFKETVVIVDAHQEDYYKGLCFVYGTKPKDFHVIEAGHAVRFEPTKEHRLFAYQYNPVDLQLSYTPYRAHA